MALTTEKVLSLLTEQPERIGALTEGLTPEQLRTRPAPDEWSINDILAHLRSCADMWGGSIETILAEDHPTIRAINPRTWIRQTDYPDLEFQPSFQAFRRQRAELLDVLNGLPPESWSRSATVTGAGKPLERTVHFYAQWLATHERSHLKQIGRLADSMRS